MDDLVVVIGDQAPTDFGLRAGGFTRVANQFVRAAIQRTHRSRLVRTALDLDETEENVGFAPGAGSLMGAAGKADHDEGKGEGQKGLGFHWGKRFECLAHRVLASFASITYRLISHPRGKIFRPMKRTDLRIFFIQAERN
jgi:hypothetical protein